MHICTLVKYIILRQPAGTYGPGKHSFGEGWSPAGGIEKPDVFARQLVPNNCVDKVLELIKNSDDLLFADMFKNIPQPSKVTHFPAFDRDGNILKYQLIFVDTFGDVKYDEKESEKFHNE